MADPISVVDGYEIAMNNHSLDAAASVFADDATIRIEPPPVPPDRENYNGKQEISKRLGELMQENYHAWSRNFEATGNRITWISDIHADRYRKLGVDPVEVINEATLEGDLIKSLTITLTPDALNGLEGAYARAHS